MRQESDFQQFAIWLQRSVGHVVLEEEIKAVCQVLSKLPGDNIVMLGDPVQGDMIAPTHFLLKVMVTEGEKTFLEGATVRANYDALPFQPNSIDVIILPHTLEFYKNPYQILREIDLILKPEGHLVVLGFNPYSWWGIRRLFSMRDRMPWQGNFRSVKRLKEWLRVLELQTEKPRYFLYRSPFLMHGFFKHFAFIETIGRYLCPAFGAEYILVAKKRLLGMTPLKVRWRRLAHAVSGRLAKPATRGARLEEKS